MTTNIPTQQPVIIVGGGLSGLSAAAILARAGHTVTLFEKAGDVGGRAMTKQHGNFSFNQGAHALYLHGPAEKLLNELGIHYSGKQPAASKYMAFDKGKLHSLPYSASSVLRTTLLSAGEKLELGGLFAALQHTKLTDLHSVSLQDWLDQHVRHPQVRQFMLAGARVASYTNAPELESMSLIIPLLSARVVYLDGGWQTLVDGLRQAALEAGVKIVARARVAAIEPGEEGHTVRTANGELYLAAAVLLAVDPVTASELVAHGTHEELSRWAAQAIPARVACFDVALRRLPNPDHVFALGIDRSFYYSVHSTWAKLAPEGSALIHIMKYFRPDEPAEPEGTRQELEAFLDQLQPGWRAEVMEQYFLPHMIASNAVVQARYGGLPGRPGPTVPGIRNLYVAGDWVGTEGQLSDACFASASNAASMIMATLAAQQSDRAVV